MDAIKNLPHILSTAKQVYKFLSNIGSLPEKTMFAKYIKKELIELLPGPQILKKILESERVAIY